MTQRLYLADPMEPGTSLTIDVGLALEIGLNESIFLRKLLVEVNLATKAKQHVTDKNGRIGIQASSRYIADNWLPFWSHTTISRICHKLIDAGLLWVEEEKATSTVIMGVNDLSGLKSVYVGDVTGGVADRYTPVTDRYRVLQIVTPNMRTNGAVSADRPEDAGDKDDLTQRGVYQSVTPLIYNTNSLSNIYNLTEAEIQEMRQSDHWHDLCNSVLTVCAFVSPLSLKEEHKEIIDALLYAKANPSIIRAQYARGESGTFWDQCFRSNGKNGRKRTPYPKDILDTYLEASEYGDDDNLLTAAQAQAMDVI